MMANWYMVAFFLVIDQSIITFGEKFTGPGKWSVVAIAKCEDDDDMPIKLDATRRKINRTHDGYTANLHLPEAIDETYGIRIDICKSVEGGCKPYHVVTDDSFSHLVLKYAQSNVEQALYLAEIDPPELPVAAGDYEVKNYVLNFDEMPVDCPYGEYAATTYLTQAGLYKSCVYVIVRCDELDSAEEEC